MSTENKPATIRVQLCYALPNVAPQLLTLDVLENTSIAQAWQNLETAHFLEVQKLLALHSTWAIFGKTKKADAILQEGDRIELCRPLIADPMSARRHRAKREHKSGKM